MSKDKQHSAFPSHFSCCCHYSQDAEQQGKNCLHSSVSSFAATAATTNNIEIDLVPSKKTPTSQELEEPRINKLTQYLGGAFISTPPHPFTIPPQQIHYNNQLQSLLLPPPPPTNSLFHWPIQPSPFLNSSPIPAMSANQDPNNCLSFTSPASAWSAQLGRSAVVTGPPKGSLANPYKINVSLDYPEFNGIFNISYMPWMLKGDKLHNIILICVSVPWGDIHQFCLLICHSTKGKLSLLRVHLGTFSSVTTAITCRTLLQDGSRIIFATRFQCRMLQSRTTKLSAPKAPTCLFSRD